MDKHAFFSAFKNGVVNSAASGFGEALGTKSLSMIGKISNNVMSTVQRRDKEKILKNISVLYPQLTSRNKQKVDVAFEVICTLKPELLNNALLSGKIIDDATRSNDIIKAVREKLNQIEGIEEE